MWNFMWRFIQALWYRGPVCRFAVVLTAVAEAILFAELALAGAYLSGFVESSTFWPLAWKLLLWFIGTTIAFILAVQYAKYRGELS